MALSQKDSDKIVKFVKKEPRSVQEISRLIERSWVTTDSYLKILKERTGLIDIKTFRKGSQGALKVVYYNSSETAVGDDIKESLCNQVRFGRRKTDFDFMEVFQYVPKKEKRCFLEEYNNEQTSTKQHISSLFRQANATVHCFSGNLSFVNLREGKTSLLFFIEELLNAGVRFKILCRVNIASDKNISLLEPLMRRFPESIEIRHCYHPLRGFIIDDKFARFKDEESLGMYKQGELKDNTRIFYDIHSAEWVSWLQKVFWNLWRISPDHKSRLQEIERLF